MYIWIVLVILIPWFSITESMHKWRTIRIECSSLTAFNIFTFRWPSVCNYLKRESNVMVGNQLFYYTVYEYGWGVRGGEGWVALVGCAPMHLLVGPKIMKGIWKRGVWGVASNFITHSPIKWHIIWQVEVLAYFTIG